MEILRTTKIIRTGTSLCIVIPKSIRDALNMERGDQVAFGIVDERTLAIRKLTQQDLVNLITPKK